MSEKSGIFDMIGPIMVGPSSSHTAGVVRIGRVCLRIFGKSLNIENIEVTFYNSFARTYEGHGSDRAIISGILDFKTDDPRIKTVFDLIKDREIQYSFKAVANASTLHPNTVKVKISNSSRSIEVVGQSLGGGRINIAYFDGFKAGFSAGMHTLIIKADDIKGMIAFVASVISNDECNIASMSVSRKGKNDLACHVIEMDSGVRPITLEYLRSLKAMEEIIYIPDIDL